MTWDQNLNGEAYNIAASNEQNIRVLSGPGTGKSFSLMRRITRLLEEEDVDPSKILVLTFTNASADDLKEEISNLGVEGVENINAQTLHSFCFSLLNKENVFDFVQRSPRPLFEFEKDPLKEDLMRRLSLRKKGVDEKLKDLASGWARLQHEEPNRPINQEDQNFENELISYLRFHQAILLEELVPLALSYLRQNPHSDEFERFDFIFVDEYQDLNKAEQAFINILASNKNIMVIGDDDQSIYEKFRNANPEGIVNYGRQSPNIRSFYLNECRRCPSTIVQYARQLISFNNNREEKNLIEYEGNEEGNVQIIQWQDLEEEGAGIASLIEQKLNEGYNPNDILILSPRREIGRRIQNNLSQSGIKNYSFFNEDLLSQDDAKVAFTILSLLNNRRDKIAIRYFLGLEGNRQNSAGYNRIINYCYSEQIDLIDVLNHLNNDEIQISYTNPIVENYNFLLQELEALDQLNLQEKIHRILPNESEWTQIFYEIIGDLENYDSVEEVFNRIRKYLIKPDPPVNADYVRFMTLHKSKGLSAKIVFLVGAIDGLIPSIIREENPELRQRLHEEQRRLFYVAITRAKEELLISSVYQMPAGLAQRMNVRPENIRFGIARTRTTPFIEELSNHPIEVTRGNNLLNNG